MCTRNEDSSVEGDSSDVAIDQDPPTFVTEQPAYIAILIPSRAQKLRPTTFLLPKKERLLL